MAIEPMYLQEVEKPEDCKFLRNGLIQTKEDGIRAFLHVKDSRVIGLRDKHNKPISMNFPELNAIVLPAVKEGIIDGEIVVLKNGKSVFNGGIDQRRSIPSAMKMAQFPATFIAFDILKLNGENLTNKPLKFRWEKLKEVIVESGLIKLVKTYPNYEVGWKEVVENNLEGLVIKHPEAPYQMGKRVDHQVKLKYRKDADVWFDGYEVSPTGIILTNKDGVRVACNGEKHIKVKKLLDEKGKILVTISYQEKIGENVYRQPTYKRLTEE